MTFLFIVLIWSAFAIFLFFRMPTFGKKPSGKRLERIKRSPNYKNGAFQNLSFTPQLAEDASMPKILFEFLFSKKENLRPLLPFNFSKTDLKNLDPLENIYVWMGHSSYFIQIEGKRLLIDPVFSGNASPVKFTTKSFPGSDIYSTEDIPELDYLIITHDHWDHLDYETILKLNPKVKNVITGLGTGAHLEHWNYDPEKITELDWYESSDLGSGFKITAEPSRHYSGRTFVRSKSLWASFVFETPNRKIYIGGDSGYGTHFQSVGEKYDGFDLAILENGQYNKDWRYIHLLPEEFLIAAKDLKAKTIIPVHNSKFVLATHSWQEPLEKITKFNEAENLRLITPKIGEKIYWEDDSISEKWWRSQK